MAAAAATCLGICCQEEKSASLHAYSWSLCYVVCSLSLNSQAQYVFLHAGGCMRGADDVDAMA
jgi:hypothetical protein